MRASGFVFLAGSLPYSWNSFFSSSVIDWREGGRGRGEARQGRAGRTTGQANVRACQPLLLQPASSEARRTAGPGGGAGRRTRLTAMSALFCAGGGRRRGGQMEGTRGPGAVEPAARRAIDASPGGGTSGTAHHSLAGQGASCRRRRARCGGVCVRMSCCLLSSSSVSGYGDGQSVARRGECCWLGWFAASAATPPADAPARPEFESCPRLTDDPTRTRTHYARRRQFKESKRVHKADHRSPPFPLDSGPRSRRGSSRGG